MKRVRTLAARVPASLSMLVVMWALFAVFGSRGRDVLGYGLAGEEHIASLLTAGLTSSHVAGMVYSSLAVLVFAVPAEVLLTTRRFVVAAIASHAVAVPTGAVAAIIVERAGFNQWGGDLVSETYLSPAAWIFGSLAFTTSSMGVMWRRRVRLVLIALTATLVLYDGSLNAVVAFSAVLIGCAAGHLVIGAEIDRRRSSVRESRILVAVLFAAVSLGPVLVAFNPAAHGPFADVSQLMWEPAVAANEVLLRCVDANSATCQEALQINQQSGLGPLLLNIAPLVASLVVALGLRRGRCLAWIFAVVSTLISLAVILVQLVGWVDSFLLAFNVALVVLPWLVVLAVLIVTRSRFGVRSQWRPALVGTLAALAVCASIWVVGAMANPGFVERASLRDVLLETPLRFMPPVIALFWPPYVIPQSALSWLLYEWVGIAFWAAAIYFLHRALTSVPSQAAESERGHAKEILMRGTGDHLAWMGLWEGNRYFFADGGTGYVAYRISNNVALTLGEPVFTEGSTRDDVADAFEAYAAEQGWRVAWYSVSGDFARAGFRTIHVAEESLLYADNLEFKGKKFQNIRTARNRAGKEGVSALWSSWAQLDVETREKVVALSEQWMSDKALPEMGFTLGSVDELSVDGTMLLLALGDDGRLHGVTSWLPVYEGGEHVGYTLDFMRRGPAGFRPTIEFLLAEAAQVASDEGLQWVSLSGAPLARTGEPESVLEVILDKAGASIEPLYGFRSLAASKYKFHPTHSGWYLAYDDELALGSIALAVVNCYLPTMRASDYAGVVKEFLASRGADRAADRAAEKSPAPASTAHP